MNENNIDDIEKEKEEKNDIILIIVRNILLTIGIGFIIKSFNFYNLVDFKYIDSYKIINESYMNPIELKTISILLKSLFWMIFGSLFVIVSFSLNNKK